MIIDSNKNCDNIILNFLDHKFDKMSHKYHSSILKFDIKKIFCDNSIDFQHYYLSAFSIIKMQFFYNKEYTNFNNFEKLYLLKQMNIITLNMVPFDLENILLNEYDFNNPVNDFFQSFEFLGGQSLADLYLKNPTKIN